MEAPNIDVEAQEGLLGCALLGSSVAIQESGITQDSFVDAKCRMAWDAIEKLLEAKHEVTMVAINREHQELEPMWLAGLADKAPIASNWNFWLPRVKDVAARYQVWSLCSSVNAQARQDVPAEELVAAIEAGLLKVSGASIDVQDNTKEGWRELCDVLDKAGDQTVVGLKTGINSIDKVLRGLKRGTMNTVAGRPGFGKSALAANLALKAAKEDQRVLVFTAEMKAREYQARLLAIDSKVDVQSYLENKWASDEKSLFVSLSKISKLPITIVDDPSINARQMRSYARKVARSGLALVVVDYLQLYRSGRKTRGREEEVSEVSKAMKQMAMECDVPVMVLAQMNRDIEKRESKPRLSDLRESGSIEQDSDTVSFLWQDSGGMLSLCIEKNRNGGQGVAPVKFTKHNQIFEDLPCEGFESGV